MQNNKTINKNGIHKIHEFFEFPIDLLYNMLLSVPPGFQQIFGLLLNLNVPISEQRTRGARCNLSFHAVPAGKMLN